MIERALIEYAINALWQVPLLAGHEAASLANAVSRTHGRCVELTDACREKL